MTHLPPPPPIYSSYQSAHFQQCGSRFRHRFHHIADETAASVQPSIRRCTNDPVSKTTDVRLLAPCRANRYPPPPPFFRFPTSGIFSPCSSQFASNEENSRKLFRCPVGRICSS
ncbi:hypothetical protein Salat_2894100 [Sesamum alatum]|uniref:Uncharacterized protein n=1 Tax=Sesamum alatum TaxID=300844 RepID=A0AAE1XIA4_9LAMI|nr:hypothetical protein Salat_2894100 [Sesamum alatum]